MAFIFTAFSDNIVIYFLLITTLYLGSIVNPVLHLNARNSLNRRTEFRVLRTTYGILDANGNPLPAAVRQANLPRREEDALPPEGDDDILYFEIE